MVDDTGDNRRLSRAERVVVVVTSVVIAAAAVVGAVTAVLEAAN